MTLRDQVAQAPDKVTARRLVAAEAVRAPVRSFTRGRLTVTVTTDPEDLGDGTISLTLAIVRAGRDVTPAGLNPVRIHDLPYLVADPQGSEIVTTTDREGVTTTERCRIDPRQRLIDTLRDHVDLLRRTLDS